MRIINPPSNTEQRKALLVDLIEMFEENTFINQVTAMAMFGKYSQDVEDYKYFDDGYTVFIASLQAEIDTDGEYGTFLLGFIDDDEGPDPTTVMETIEDGLLL